MNLIQKSIRNYLDRGPAPSSVQTPPINVNGLERAVSAGIGLLMVRKALRNPSLTSLIVGGVGASLLYRSFTGHCGLYSRMGVTSSKPAAPERYFHHGIHVEVATTINRSPEDLYTFWRKLENLPAFMRHLEAVSVIDERTSRWVAKGPAGMRVQWDAEIINDEPGSLIAWRSLGGAQVDNAGSVRFLPALGGIGTEVRVVLDYLPPAGAVGKFIARLFGEEPSQQIEEDLKRFKQLMEIDEPAS